MMRPASDTAAMQARTLDLKSMSKELAASVPVHAPVPGSGMPTNNSAHGEPRPAVAFNFAPPLWRFEAEGEELADDRLIRTPLQHLAGKEEDERHGEHIADDGDDVHLPQRQAHSHAHEGIAPRSSIRGTMKSKSTLRYFVSI